MGSYRALVTDFGGVLTTPLVSAMAEFCARAEIDLQDLVRAALTAYTGGEDDLVTGFETGRISEHEFNQAFAQRLSDLTERPIEPEGLVERLFAGLELEKTMLVGIEAARNGGLKTALLSNSWGQRLYPRDLLDGMFDVVVISEEVGLRKPDRAIFDLTVGRLGVPAPECIFVDDHVGHIDAAREVGMTTVLHRNPAETLSRLEDLLGLSLR